MTIVGDGVEVMSFRKRDPEVMQKIIKTYCIASIVWIVFSFFVMPLTGEAALITSLLSSTLAAPLGLFSVLLFSFIVEPLSIYIREDIITIAFMLFAFAIGLGQWLLIKKIRSHMIIDREQSK